MNIAMFKKLISIPIFLILISTVWPIEPINLLKRAWDNEGTIHLYGKISSLGYFGERKVSSEIELYWQPPKKIRREFYSDNRLRLVLVSDETSEWRYFPQRNMVMFSEPPIEFKMTPSRLQLLLQNYQIKSVGQERLLNRAVEVIELIPKYQGNPSRRFWVDKKQPIILRFEQYNSESKKILTSYFTKLTFDKNIKVSTFAFPSTAKVINQSNTFNRRDSIENAEKELKYSLKTATYLPPGYIFDGCYLWQPRFRGSRNSIQLRYTDGLNMVSIFEHPIDREQPERDMRKGSGRREQWGKSSRSQQGREPERRKYSEDTTRDGKEYYERQQGKIIRINIGSMQCVIVGDLPQKELQKIAQGLK